MKITKRILAAMLGLTMLIAIPQCASANVTTVVNNEVAHMSKFVQVWGKVEEKNDGKIHIKNSSNINNDMILNISHETIIIDAVSGLPVPLKDINLNEDIYAYISPVMTLSLPPMSNAKAIIVNIPQDFKVPNYIEVQSINQNYDGSITVKSDDGLVEATLDRNTNVFPYLTKNIVTIDNIKIGSTLFLWGKEEKGKMQTMENTKKIKVEKSLIMPYGYSALIKASVNNVNIDGKDIYLTSKEVPFMQEKTLMVPLKVVAEACGYNVSLNNKRGVATMTKEGSKTYSVTINSDMINLEDTNCYLRNKTILKNNTIFVSADLFNLAQNAKVVVE
ncbi:stalk domain-containing protein [Clostridium uliginosum]|uniref:Copper amine oxidase N-terminal domain-containing protein n=1 Tax=Clostridium uliginosum TaxID=119641 RepID=A0A1I1QPZ3_9CLOT|nr:stalk domain-containing protein [Clostridium uliginosum]SFD24181.1 Copper amine oxidase N-terminal domain-containing protein [Clostridium uliginosum]